MTAHSLEIHNMSTKLGRPDDSNYQQSSHLTMYSNSQTDREGTLQAHRSQAPKNKGQNKKILVLQLNVFLAVEIARSAHER